MFSGLLSTTVLCLVTSSFALVTRSTPEVGEKFGLYAYGDSLGGVPLFYADGKAFVGDSSNSTSSSIYNVTFERTSASSSSPWLANPNGTTAADTNWSEKMLYIPSSSASSDQIGFISNAGDNEITTGFVFYGQSVMVETAPGDYSTSFYVRPSSQGEGIYSLLWNVTGDDTIISISLRSVEPSNA
ncbi:hypothetical protein BGW36DRAFT_427412 [Talaromyces proteolyticus]|uniref:Uncharacterized protein n=1 Tax=Talaromyces proteolyticus TaxID=1131652 RepID=A0AAD4KUT7_9EURO|nr:uncharacterized protein BGW36DRAFT_427412 [Talaromyces proteolyticus]KAH8697450.1 hypothetical protein BGW36DRAFT_427412 [Talaromyces proteolyticus]